MTAQVFSNSEVQVDNIPFQNLGRLHGTIREEIDEAISGVVDRSAFVGASNSEDFEVDFAAAHDVAHARGCGSGTDALALALRGLNIGPGDEVIVPAMTFIATAEAVVHVGATPVVVDCNETDLLIDPEAVDVALTERTKAIMPVHLYGTPVSVDLIEQWRASGLIVVEDAAQAHLASSKGRFVGTAANAACFSFYPGKNLGAFGDGGAVITNDEALAERVGMLRDHGRSEKYSHAEIGFCSRLDGLQAAILGVKLRHLPSWTASRRALFAEYETHLEELLVPAVEGSVHHLVVMKVDSVRRDEIVHALRDRGIGCGIHYPIPLNEQPSMDAWPSTAPKSSAAARSIVSLPMDPLMTIDEVRSVCEAVRQVV